MKITKKITLILLACVSILSFSGAVGAFIPKALADVRLVQDVILEEEYALGTELTIPQAQIEVDGKVYDAQTLLYFPNGDTVSSQTVVLNQHGKYTLEYRAVTEQGIKKVTLSFLVNEYLYSTDSRSSAVYGANEFAPQRPGVVTSLAMGEKFYFNQIIDLTGKTKNDSLVELFVTPQKQGLADALNLVFVFTDLYDSENTVTVTCKRLDREPLQATWQELNLYTTTNAAGQAPTGLELNGSGDFIYNGSIYKLHRNNIYGSCSRFAMAGIPNVNSDCSVIGNPEDVANQTLKVSFDYENRIVYVNGNMVADLDDIVLYPTKQWGGFTTGECKLSIYATSYNQSNFNMVVTKLDNIAGESLSQLYIKDREAPTLTMQYGEYEQSGYPDAVVSRPYKLPEVIAYDALDKYLDVTANVYYAYGQNTQAKVKVQNGSFTPTLEGKYTVVYTASDLSGNTETLEYVVNAKVVSEPLSIELSQADNSGKTGEVITVSSAQVLNAQGNAYYEIVAEYINEAQGIYQSIEIAKDGENAFTFCPLYAGEWTIKYNYNDYMETKSESYVINVEGNARPYIADDVVLPRYVIKGATYQLPSLSGYTFDGGVTTLANSVVYIKDDNGAERKLNGSGFTSYAKEKTTLIYRLGEGENVFEKRYELPVIDVKYDGDLSIKDYFIGENFESIAGNDRITLTTTEKGNHSFEFINPLQVFDFRTVFRVPASANKYKRINIYLTDSLDSSIVVKVSYIRNTAGNTIFIVNDGGTEYTASSDFIESNNENFRLIYNNRDRKISPSTAYSVQVAKDLSGKEFNGFTSNKVYITFELCDITGTASIDLFNLNNQTLSKVNYDLIKPEVSSSSLVGERYLGDHVVIDATYMVDVLDPNLTYKMYVKTPSDKYAVATDGTVLKEGTNPEKEYVVVASEYGSYSVYYECSDVNKNRTIYSYVFTIVDVKAPDASISGMVMEYKVGDTIIVPSLTATDDYTSVSCVISVKYPDSTRVTLKGNSFIATMAGEYTVLYLVYDETFNLTTLTHVITVK